MINFDTNQTPKGYPFWQALLAAIEGSSATDENEWLEHKADLDPLTKDGGATVAKAIIAFANRDPDRAAGWLEGTALIVVGIEPGRIPGTAETDPAKIHQSVSRYLTPPEPAWEPTHHKYKGQNVLVISVARPAAGDRTAMFHGSTGDYKDGTIYVRRPGKSEVALSADLRRLEDRSRTAEPRDLALTVEVEGDATVPQLDYSSDWVEQWVARERQRLLKPFHPPPASPARTARLQQLPSELEQLGLGGMSTRDQRQSMLDQSLHDMNSQMSSALDGLSRIETATLLHKQHDEDRSEEEFRAETDAYLERCRSQLPAAIDALRSSTAASITFAVRNNAVRNFAGVVIDLHVEGDVDGFDWRDQPPSLRQLGRVSNVERRSGLMLGS